jgi:membrane-associated protease RseP (regulator of RpoE activity)
MILAYVLWFALAMLIHELGHLVAARVCGVRASELGIGWGPRIFGFSAGGVEYKLHALPIGAYVRLDMKKLQGRRLSIQVFILLAGILVNILAAIFARGTWFGAMNFLLAATNLLPLYQQDGWKCGMVMIRAALRRRSPLVEWAFTIAGGGASLILFGAQAFKYYESLRHY